MIKLLLSNDRILYYLKDMHGKDAMNISNYNCRAVIREEMFRKKIKRLKRYALSYARSTILNRDVWLMILFRSLEMTMSNYTEYHRRRCQIFAEELHIPYNINETKIELVLKISETLSIAPLFGPHISDYLFTRKNLSKKIINDLIYSSQKLGVLTHGKTLSKIIRNIELIANIKWK